MTKPSAMLRLQPEPHGTRLGAYPGNLVPTARNTTDFSDGLQGGDHG